MDKSDERRVSVRTPFFSQGFCHVREINKKYSGMVRDISITGLFMEMNDSPGVGHKCDIDIVFKGKYSRLVIEKVGGTITRRDEDGVAVRFDERLEWFVLIPLYFHKLHKQPKPE
ncbi:MAG: hypothetical protein GQ542_10090 [Desulforhopalus sp.]|nr:hypothetical protein [Desulforhopalus sp.]